MVENERVYITHQERLTIPIWPQVEYIPLHSADRVWIHYPRIYLSEGFSSQSVPVFVIPAHADTPYKRFVELVAGDSVFIEHVWSLSFTPQPVGKNLYPHLALTAAFIFSDSPKVDVTFFRLRGGLNP